MEQKERLNKQMTFFDKKVLKITKRIPKGKVLTYGEIARLVGFPGAGRAVGNALHKNPFPHCAKNVLQRKMIPCHRVVRSDGRIGGYGGGQKEKTELLRREGLEVKKGRVDLGKFLITLRTR